MAVEDEALPDADKVQHIYRLLHDLCEMGADTHTWRVHMLEEMEQMLSASLSFSYVMRFSLDPTDFVPKTVVYIERGTNQGWKDYLAAGDLSRDPMTPQIMQRFGTDFTVRREDWVDDETWYGSEYFKTVRVPADLDSGIYSQIGVRDPKVIDGLSVARRVGEPRFTPGEVSLVRLLHQELARLWNREDPIGMHTLPPRQRETLDGIRRGETRKVIAEKMGVTGHTVHSYEKALFDRASVSSRGELLAKVAKLVRPNLLP